MQSYKRLIYNKYFLKGLYKMEGVIRISTELYLLNYLYREDMISEQEYREIKKYINLVQSIEKNVIKL